MPSQIFALSTFLSDFVQALKEQINPIGKNISEEISSTLDYSPRFSIQIGNYHFGVTDAILSLIISMVVITILAFLFTRKLNVRPTKKQMYVEMLIDAVVSICKNAGLNESQTKQVLPFTTTIGLLIVTSNVLSVFKIKPAAQNPAFPIFLALLAVVYILFMTIKFIGLRGFWKALLYPKAGLLPFKILDLCIKPISLSFRLFGNIFGAFILMEFVGLIVPLFVPGILGLWFDLGDGIVQGGVFAYLTIIYIGEFLENAHHYDEEATERKEERARKNRENLIRKQNAST